MPTGRSRTLLPSTLRGGQGSKGILSGKTPPDKQGSSPYSDFNASKDSRRSVPPRGTLLKPLVSRRNRSIMAPRIPPPSPKRRANEAEKSKEIIPLGAAGNTYAFNVLMPRSRYTFLSANLSSARSSLVVRTNRHVLDATRRG